MSPPSLPGHAVADTEVDRDHLELKMSRPGAAPAGQGVRAPGAGDDGRSAAWFEEMYRAADGDAGAIRWADERPSPLMVAWLNAEAPGLVRPGSRVVVVGCGLGDDVAELAGRGYDVVGFDVSPTAVEWARRRFPDLTSCFVHADLLALPPRMCRRFDLVVEISTLQSLPPELRSAAARAVTSLASSKGHVLAICRRREPHVRLSEIHGPPWPLTESELVGLMEEGGLCPHGPVQEIMDRFEDPPAMRLRGLFGR